jgi:CubicO group peptidase (beta-lactamase class C family)
MDGFFLTSKTVWFTIRDGGSIDAGQVAIRSYIQQRRMTRLVLLAGKKASMRFDKPVIILLVLASVPLTNTGAVADEPFAGVREKILQELKEKRIPSIAVAVARGDQILWEEGFGWSDKENKVAATAHTPYVLGSTSKPITATAVMTLRERGQVDLDRPINNYLDSAKLQARLGIGSHVP